MSEVQSLGPEVTEQIRAGLARLRSRNAFHDFEHLCLDFAREALDVRFIPATGPVGAGGDQGRDFETYESSTPTGEGKAVGLCTTQTGSLPTKIRSDLDRIAAGGPVDKVYAFLTADLPVARTHKLQAEAKSKYGITLVVFDGYGLAKAMSTMDFAATAFRRLHLDPRILSTAARTTDEAKRWAKAVLPDRPQPKLHEYLVALRQVSRKRDLPAAEQIPDLTSLYQPLLLAGPGGVSRTWEQALADGHHLVVTGSAGAGKSALLRHIATTLADQWLRREPRPWLPVLVQARDLVSGKPLERALRAGVEQTLGGRLLRRLELDFIDQPSPASHWLILVDGLDEVHDHRKVLDAVGNAVDDWPMQFVITSRPFGQDLDRDWCTHHTLQPFDHSSLDRFITEWFAHSGIGSEALRSAARALIYRLDAAGWEPNPLFALMACVIAHSGASTPGRAISTSEIYSAFTDQLVKRLEPTPVPAVNAIQDRIHQLLKSIASHRHFEDPDAKMLDLALRWAEEHRIEPADPQRADWPRTVQQVLLRSGLITSDRGELVFFHPSLQEYYASRTLIGSSPEEWLDALEQTPYQYDTGTDLVLSQTTFLEFLLNRDNEDAFVAAVLNAFPDAVEEVVEHYGSHNLGHLTATALETIAADRHQHAENRATAARALAVLDPEAGVPFRLGLSTDPDLRADERLHLVTNLVRSGGRAPAAIQWLVFQTWGAAVDSMAECEIRSLMSFEASDEDKAGALRLIATTEALPECHRIAACADLVHYDAAEAYGLFLTVDQPRSALLELVDSGSDYWPTLHQRFVRDDANTFADRMWAVELIEDDDPDQAEKYFRELENRRS